MDQAALSMARSRSWNFRSSASRRALVAGE
jgi:hypothetical protein